MKTFFVALLALPAVLAAPAPSAGSFQSLECACMNAAGETRSSGTCQYKTGQLNGSYCHRAASWAPEMNTVFNDQSCAEIWGAEWNKGVCRTVTLCEGAAGPEYYTLC